MAEQTPSPPTGASALLRSLGLLVDGPVAWGGRVASRAAGVFVVELPTGQQQAPIDHGQLQRWLERVPTLQIDGAPPTPHELGRRLSAFWLPREPILYVGRSARALGPRIAALFATPLGDARPHSGGHWLKTLSVLKSVRVWWAETDAHEEYEDALLSAVADRVSTEVAAALPDPDVVLPFANLSTADGRAKRHGIRGALRDAEASTGTRPAGLRSDGPSPVPGKPQVPRVTRPRQPAKPKALARPQADPAYVSQTGLDRLVAELDHLRNEIRPQVIARVKAARELGDLRENADYEAARNEQSFTEGRIQALERLLKTTQVVSTPADAGLVAVGSTVEVESGGESEVFSIVGSTESEPSAGRISNASPVGRALLGKRAGDEVTVNLPAGPVRYRIRDVR